MFALVSAKCLGGGLTFFLDTTSSSPVAEKPRDALCPSVVSFNGVIPRAGFFYYCYLCSDLPLPTIKLLLCCLWRNVGAPSHKHFVSRHQQTPPLTSDYCHQLAMVRHTWVRCNSPPSVLRDRQTNRQREGHHYRIRLPLCGAVFMKYEKHTLRFQRLYSYA